MGDAGGAGTGEYRPPITPFARKHGYRVIANSRTITDSPHPEVASVAGDIADATASERLVSDAVARFGRIDTLINNVGVFLPKPFVFYTADDYELVTSVNVLGFFRITHS
jgi:NAD(P)-dependent dehydrogenase (short-subunit alcohol dehydrogenase family)